MARPVVALATSAQWPDLDTDGALLLTALADAGVDARPVVWDDPDHDWAADDLVVVRSTWDYTDRLPEFLSWAAQVPRLANPAAVVAWNTDTRDRCDLAAAGVPVTPTPGLAPGEPFVAPPGEYVVKPTVSAGARDTARYGPAEAGAAAAHVAGLHAAGRHVMVQPYLQAVDTAGETSVLLFDGAFSHAARKAALLAPLAGVRQDLSGRATITPTTATPEQRALAARVLAAVPGGAPLLYARVDMVPGPDGAPLLLELELVEPSLFLRQAEGAPAWFAAAIAGRVGR